MLGSSIFWFSQFTNALNKCLVHPESKVVGAHILGAPRIERDIEFHDSHGHWTHANFFSAVEATHMCRNPSFLYVCVETHLSFISVSKPIFPLSLRARGPRALALRCRAPCVPDCQMACGSVGLKICSTDLSQNPAVEFLVKSRSIFFKDLWGQNSTLHSHIRNR